MASPLLPCCPLCDQPIGVYEEHTVYVENDCKALAHLDCVVDLGDEDEFGEDDGIEYVQFPDEDDEDEDDDEWD
jgi:hypothetical protein